MENIKPFGDSLYLDCSSLYLEDTNHCERFLMKLVKSINVSIQAPPAVIVTSKEFENKASLSAWASLVESGIAVSEAYTLIMTNALFVYLFCCREFDRAMV